MTVMIINMLIAIVFMIVVCSGSSEKFFTTITIIVTMTLVIAIIIMMVIAVMLIAILITLLCWPQDELEVEASLHRSRQESAIGLEGKDVSTPRAYDPKAMSRNCMMDD